MIGSAKDLMEQGVIRRRGMLLLGIAVVLIAGSAWGQPVPRILQLGAITCRELQELPGERRDRLLIYLTGYLDGKRGAAAWDEALTGQRIDRAIAACKASPDASLLRVFTEAWSR
jgi:hypothetical protein